MYSPCHLQSDAVVGNVASLLQRVEQRFPEGHLRQLSADLLEVAKHTEHRVAWLNRPDLGVRLLRLGLQALLAIVLVAGTAAQLYVVTTLSGNDITEFFQGLDATLNIIVLVAGGTYGLSRLQDELRRRRTLPHLAEIRSLIQVIDLHQFMDHDPQHPPDLADVRQHHGFLAEMLTLTSKIASLYARDTTDGLILRTVNDVDRMARELSLSLMMKSQMSS